MRLVCTLSRLEICPDRNVACCEVSVPVKGQYYLRTSIHDLNSDRIGAVEVPIAAVAKLDPLMAAAAPAAAPSSTPADATPAPK